MSNFNVPSINKIMITATVINDPRVNLTTESKNKVVNFRIGSNRKFRTKSGNLKEETCYISVTAWLRLAEICENNLKKGDKIYIEGTLQSKQLSDSKISVVEILADRIQILTPKRIISSVQDKTDCVKEDEVHKEEIVEEHE